jgi:hypothetical protein
MNDLFLQCGVVSLAQDFSTFFNYIPLKLTSRWENNQQEELKGVMRDFNVKLASLMSLQGKAIEKEITYDTDNKLKYPLFTPSLKLLTLLKQGVQDVARRELQPAPSQEKVLEKSVPRDQLDDHLSVVSTQFLMQTNKKKLKFDKKNGMFTCIPFQVLDSPNPNMVYFWPVIAHQQQKPTVAGSSYLRLIATLGACGVVAGAAGYGVYSSSMGAPVSTNTSNIIIPGLPSYVSTNQCWYNDTLGTLSLEDTGKISAVKLVPKLENLRPSDFFKNITLPPYVTNFPFKILKEYPLLTERSSILDFLLKKTNFSAQYNVAQEDMFTEAALTDSEKLKKLEPALNKILLETNPSSVLPQIQFFLKTHDLQHFFQVSKQKPFADALYAVLVTNTFHPRLSIYNLLLENQVLNESANYVALQLEQIKTWTNTIFQNTLCQYFQTNGNDNTLLEAIKKANPFKPSDTPRVFQQDFLELLASDLCGSQNLGLTANVDFFDVMSVMDHVISVNELYSVFSTLPTLKGRNAPPKLGAMLIEDITAFRLLAESQTRVTKSMFDIFSSYVQVLKNEVQSSNRFTAFKNWARSLSALYQSDVMYFVDPSLISNMPVQYSSSAQKLVQQFTSEQIRVMSNFLNHLGLLENVYNMMHSATKTTPNYIPQTAIDQIGVLTNEVLINIQKLKNESFLTQNNKKKLLIDSVLEIVDKFLVLFSYNEYFVQQQKLLRNQIVLTFQTSETTIIASEFKPLLEETKAEAAAGNQSLLERNATMLAEGAAKAAAGNQSLLERNATMLAEGAAEAAAGNQSLLERNATMLAEGAAEAATGNQSSLVNRNATVAAAEGAAGNQSSFLDKISTMLKEGAAGNQSSLVDRIATLAAETKAEAAAGNQSSLVNTNATMAAETKAEAAAGNQSSLVNRNATMAAEGAEAAAGNQSSLTIRTTPPLEEDEEGVCEVTEEEFETNQDTTSSALVTFSKPNLRPPPQIRYFYEPAVIQPNATQAQELTDVSKSHLRNLYELVNTHVKSIKPEQWEQLLSRPIVRQNPNFAKVIYDYFTYQPDLLEILLNQKYYGSNPNIVVDSDFETLYLLVTKTPYTPKVITSFNEAREVMFLEMLFQYHNLQQQETLDSNKQAVKRAETLLHNTREYLGKENPFKLLEREVLRLINEGWVQWFSSQAFGAASTVGGTLSNVLDIVKGVAREGTNELLFNPQGALNVSANKPLSNILNE